MSFFVFVLVAILAFINMKVGMRVTKKKNKSLIQRRLIPTYIFLAIVSLDTHISILLDDHGSNK